MAKINSDEIKEIISNLQGTCDTLTGAIQEVTGNDSLGDKDLTQAQHDEIYNEIFLCGQCSWWCEVSEREKDYLCNDCYKANL